MIALSNIEAQLAKAGCRISSWGRAEVKELCNILTPGETIVQALNGYYDNGFALLVATDQRLLLVDRKPMFLTLDAISYSMIQEVLLNYRLLNSTIHIYTSNKVLIFSSWNHHRLRMILNHTQQKVLEVRAYQGYMNPQGYAPQPQPMSVPTVPQPHQAIHSTPVSSLPNGNISPNSPLNLPYEQPFLHEGSPLLNSDQSV